MRSNTRIIVLFFQKVSRQQRERKIERNGEAERENGKRKIEENTITTNVFYRVILGCLSIELFRFVTFAIAVAILLKVDRVLLQQHGL